MRLVDAENILNALDIFNDTENGNEHFLNGIKLAREIVESFPTIDAVPIIHAYWEYDSEWGYCCSNCHYQQYDDFHYCPNCGAKMDEVEE